SVGYARPNAATPITIRLVPAFNECTASNGSHGAPLALPSGNPPPQSPSSLTFNAPDRPAPYNSAAGGSGSVTLKVTCLSATNPPVESGAAPPCNAQPGDQGGVVI